MKSYLAFIDETGTLTKDLQQPYFGLGIIYLKNTANIYNDLVLVKERAISYFHSTEPFKEFKFSLVNDLNLIFYKQILNIFKIYTDKADISFESLIIDKSNPNSNWENLSHNTYEAYTYYSDKLINQLNIDTNSEKICLLVDHFCRPRDTTIFYETKLLENQHITQCCMLESHSSLFIQLVDILLGCVVYKKKFVSQNKTQLTSKLKLVKHLEILLDIDDLSKVSVTEKENFKITNYPQYIMS